MQYKNCRVCRQDRPIVFFRVDKTGTYMCRNVCLGCEQHHRDDVTFRARPAKKAHNTLMRHAQKYIKRGLVASIRDFAERYGWDTKQIAHDIEHAYLNGCPYCLESFASMANGLWDLTLDIIDPSTPPYYRTNTRWCCATCNREKQQTPPDLWGAKLQAWAAWRAWHEARQADPWYGTLFAGQQVAGQASMF